MSEKRKMLKAAGIVGSLTFFSRCLGLIRDAVMAAQLGAGRFSDVFLVAFELPNLVRRVLGEGALSSFIVPLLSERRHQKGEADGWRFFNRAANLLLLVASIITLGGCIFSREVFMIFGGFGLLVHGETEAIELGVHLTRIMFPFVIGLTAASLLMGACHTVRSFAAPSLGSVMLNITMIGAGLLALYLKAPADQTAYWLSWAVLAGAALRVVIMIPPLRAHGWRWRPDFIFADPQLRKLLKMMGLGMISVAIVQINFSVVGFFAMFLGEGFKTQIVYAQRLIQFPMALTAMAVATAMLPQLSQYLQEGRLRELREMMSLSKRVEIVMMTPAMLGLILFGYPIIELILQRNNWSAGDSYGTYGALIFYALGLLPMGWSQLMMRLYYARQDMVTPIKAAFVSMLINVVLNYIFGFHTRLEQGGLALAYTLATFAHYGVLVWGLRSLTRDDAEPAKGETRPRIIETLWKSTLAALAACGSGAWLYGWIRALVGDPTNTLSRAALLLPVIALVAVLYFLLAHLLRVPDSDRASDAILRRLKRRRRAQ